MSEGFTNGLCSSIHFIARQLSNADVILYTDTVAKINIVLMKNSRP